MFRTSIYKKTPIIQTQNLLKRYLSIKTLTTPNENAIKLQVDQSLLKDTPSLQITHENQNISPLATKIFEYAKDVDSLLIGSNFITVNKNEFAHWNQVTPLVKSILENHLENKEDIISSTQAQESSEPHRDEHYAALSEEDQEISDMVAELIETRIRPAIQDDGGDIVFMRYADGKVYVQLQGACTSCSLSDDTLKSGIQGMLSHYIDGIDEVVNLAEVEFNKFEERMRQQKETRA